MHTATLLTACLQAPDDLLARLALADDLEEQADPRAELVRLVPRLLAVADRSEPRADVPVRVWRDGNLRTSRKEWPAIKAPSPRPITGPRSPWVGLHNVGRLFASAMLRRLGVPAPMLPWLARWELANCRLLTVEQRDAEFFTLENYSKWREVALARWQRFSVDALATLMPKVLGGHHWARMVFACRAGSFGRYIWAATGATVFLGWALFEGNYVDRSEQLLARQAIIYSRILDLHDEFVRVAPWDAALEVYRKRQAGVLR